MAILVSAVLMVGLLAGTQVQSAKADPPVDTPPASDFAINVPGDVLAQAGTDGTTEATLAAAQKFNWDFAESQFAEVSGTFTSTPAAPDVALSPGEVATWDQLTSGFEAPAVEAAPLEEGTSVAADGTVVGAVAMAGFETGTYIGADVAHVFGFKDDDVCAQQNATLTVLASVLDHVDCSAFNNALAAEAKNMRENPVEAPSSACTDGICAQFVGTAPDPYSGVVNQKQFCFLLPSTLPSPAVHWFIQGATSNDPTNYQGDIYGQTESGDPVCDEYAEPGMTVIPAYSYGQSTTITDFSLILIDSNYNRVGTGTHTVTSDEITKPNPTRQFRCDITSSTGTVYSATSPSFTENDATLPLPTCPTFPDSQTPVSVKTYEATSGEPDWLLSNQSVTSAYLALRSDYPECLTGTCLLDLRQGSNSCFDGTTNCDGWFDDPTRADDYSCVYGTHVVDISECYLYAPTFNAADRADGHAYADPSTGAPIDDTQTSPTSEDMLTANYLGRTSSSSIAALSSSQRDSDAAAIAALCLAGHSLDVCETTAVWAPGSDVDEVAAHDQDAITAGEPDLLTYMTSAAKVASGVSRGWYRSSTYADGLCAGTAPSGEHCDEYPYFSTVQGGPPNTANPMGGDLRYVNSSQNTSEGAKRYAFLAGVCHLDTATGTDANFIVLPDPTLFPTFGLCAF